MSLLVRDVLAVKKLSRAPGETKCTDCLRSTYEPVCGDDNRTYYNRCLYDCIKGPPKTGEACIRFYTVFYVSF